MAIITPPPPVITLSGATASGVPPWVSGSGLWLNGKTWMNGAGVAVVPRGFDLDGYEDSVQNGANPNTLYSWNQGGNLLGYFITAILAEWKPSIIRLMLTTSSILGQGTYDTNGNYHAPGQTAQQYLAQVETCVQMIQQGLNAAVVLGIRNSCPDAYVPGQSGLVKMLPGNQGTMLDATNGIPAWVALAGLFGTGGTSTKVNRSAVLFDFFNEPIIGAGNPTGGGISGVTNTQIWGMIMGTMGYQNILCTQYPDVTGGGKGTIYTSWQPAGHQQTLNAVRAANANNICIFSGPNYTNPCSQSGDYMGGWEILSQQPGLIPVDPLVAQGYPAQIAVSWHPYQNNAPQPGSGQGGGPWTEFCNLPIAGIVLEFGDNSYGGQYGPAVCRWSDANNIPIIAWSMNATGSPCLITQTTNGNGSPTKGYGDGVFSWMSNHSQP